MRIIADNRAVAYEETGDGPVALLLHGWGNDLHSFDALVPLLSQSWRVVRLDLPGFGGSEPPEKSWEVGDYARFVEAFVGKLGISVDVLVGHSFGGRIALKGVANGLLHPKRLVLINSAGLAQRNTVRNILFKALAKVGKAALFLFPVGVKERLRRKLYEYAGADDFLRAGVSKETFLKVIGENLSRSARDVHVPTLLIWGEDDTATPLSEGKRLNALISGSELKVIDGAGHFVHQEKPREAAELIRQFVAS